MAEIHSLDTAMVKLSANDFSFGHIPPGETKETYTQERKLMISDNCPDSTILNFSVDISSNDFVYWRDTFQIKVGYGFVSGRDDSLIPVEEDISIFPNPSSDIINITGLTQPADVELYSIQGKLQKAVNQVESTIDISDLPAGIYILNLTSGDKVLRERIVKR